MMLLDVFMTYYTVLYIVVIVVLVNTYTNDNNIPHMKLDILHLIAPIVYAILYGTRTPQGFIRSIRMAICCCLPVKTVEKPPEIDDVVRYGDQSLVFFWNNVLKGAGRKIFRFSNVC